MPKILIGTASWTDKSLLQSGFYPKGADSAEERLRFYSERFPIVEVDSTYYFPPTDRNAALWAERTPGHFTFHIKAYSLFTQHPTRTASLFGDIREALRPQVADRPRLYAKDLPQEAIDQMWTRFADALMPLHSSGKLGLVHFQFPQWFTPNSKNRDYILECKQRLHDYRMGVEFRNG
ncbi:MAG TPA: DUF72 domain-containing protein, partial [Actinomycetota bacterium]|nr:DUF72 domain-containing protein [Actinomycetota bacterium]